MRVVRLALVGFFGDHSLQKLLWKVTCKQVFNTLFTVSHGLQDNSDDVRAVAAEALLPLTKALAAEPPDGLQRILWDILLEVEELSPSTGQLTCLPPLSSGTGALQPSCPHNATTLLRAHQGLLLYMPAVVRQSLNPMQQLSFGHQGVLTVHANSHTQACCYTCQQSSDLISTQLQQLHPVFIYTKCVYQGMLLQMPPVIRPHLC